MMVIVCESEENFVQKVENAGYLSTLLHSFSCKVICTSSLLNCKLIPNKPELMHFLPKD